MDLMRLSRARYSIAKILGILLWSAAATGVVLAAEPQRAEPALTEPRVVLVTEDRNSEIATLLRAELVALGFEVTSSRPEPSVDVARNLRELARTQNAVAAFLLSVSSGRVEVWVADRVTGKVTLREVIARGPGESLEARTIVLRAVELLRWSLQELDQPYPARGEVAEPPEPVRKLSRGSRAESNVGLAAGGYAAYLSGETGLGAGVSLAASLQLGSWLAQLELAQPFLVHRVSAPSGDVEIGAQWGGLSLFRALSPEHATWQPALGLGLRVLALQLRGEVDEPLVGTSARDYSLAPTARFALRLRALDHLRIILDAALVWMFQRTDVALAGAAVGSFGPWMASAGVGVELATDP